MGDKARMQQGGSGVGIWCVGWLFTIGFVKLGFWKAVLGLLLWPYFLGVALGAAR